MINWISRAFIASCLLHGMLMFIFVTFMRSPPERIRGVLPDVPVLTLVRPPQTPAVLEAAPKSKPALAKPLPPPEPVNLTAAAEPVPEPAAPEPVSQVATVDAPVFETQAAPVSIPVPIDPVYPTSRVKGGLIPIKRSEPPYPLIAEERGIEGSVDALFVVGKTGLVEDVWIAYSSHKYFSDAVTKTVRKFRFKPPVVDGKIARVKANQHFEFKLE